MQEASAHRHLAVAAGEGGPQLVDGDGAAVVRVDVAEQLLQACEVPSPITKMDKAVFVFALFQFSFDIPCRDVKQSPMQAELLDGLSHLPWIKSFTLLAGDIKQ